MSTQHCRECGNQWDHHTGPYCEHCGERKCEFLGKGENIAGLGFVTRKWAIEEIQRRLKTAVTTHEYSFDASWRRRVTDHITRQLQLGKLGEAVSYLTHI